MPLIDRFSVSLDTELLAAFDRYIADHGYDNRSEAIRDLIRDLLISAKLESGDDEVSATLSFVCDQRESETPARLRVCLAEHRLMVRGSLSAPMDDHRDRVAVILAGSHEKVRAVADRIQAMRGITHGHLSAVPVRDSPL